MSQNSHTASVTQTYQKSRSGTLLIGVGFLWLLLALALLIYQLTNPARVEITWETATEQRTVGFNVYKSDRSDEGFSLVNEETFIDSEGGPISGAHYSFIDSDVLAGETYYYILEEIELDGSRNRYTDDVFEYTVPDNTWWAVALMIFSAIIGTALLITGLKEKKKQ